MLASGKCLKMEMRLIILLRRNCSDIAYRFPCHDMNSLFDNGDICHTAVTQLMIAAFDADNIAKQRILFYFAYYSAFNGMYGCAFRTADINAVMSAPVLHCFGIYRLFGAVGLYDISL